MLSSFRFRRGHNCQNALIRLVENCKKVLGDRKVYGMLLTDLSKAFDYLPYQLLIRKLNVYDLSHDACKLSMGYFMSRRQRVKVEGCKSSWRTLSKGAQQGSIFGLFLFKRFQNDLVRMLEEISVCDIYNYADDNTVGVCAKSRDILWSSLERVSTFMFTWFTDNFMQANPGKFQMITFGLGSTPVALRVHANEVGLRWPNG